MLDTPWDEFTSRVTAQGKSRDKDFLADLRALAYTGSIPWTHDQVNSKNMKVLFASMALRLDSTQELRRLLHLMDDARAHGMPSATEDGGKILIDRAAGKRNARPLPRGWEGIAGDVVGTPGSTSGAYWAGAMLRAAGHRGPQHDGLN